jgi:hypothetical protein
MVWQPTTAPAADVVGTTAGNGAAAAAADADGGAQDGAAVTGNVVSGHGGDPDDRDATVSVPLHRHISPAVRAAMREQVADFAEYAHRSRVPSLTDSNVLGSGGGITTAVLRAVAAAMIETQPVAGLGTDPAELTESLLLSLVEPGEPATLTEAQAGCFVGVRGRLVLDGTVLDPAERPPATSIVWPDGQPEPAGPAEPVDGVQPDTASTASTASTMRPCAVLIVASVRSLAGDRPCLSLDELMAYARREAFSLSGIRAARNVEIVVLLDQTIGGGIWVDADPVNGQPVAALAIRVPAPPGRIRFTHVPIAGPAPLLTLSAVPAGH